MPTFGADPKVTGSFHAAPELLVFAIPLKPKDQCADWAQAQANLRRTILSAKAASVGHRILICIACHDEPQLEDAAGPEVVVLPVPFPQPDTPWAGGRDKARKRRFIGAWLRSRLDSAAYVMFLDADDLVRKGLVEFVFGQQAGSYLADSGYIVDLASGVVHRRRQGFHHTCGSSFVCLFEPHELPTSWEDLEATYSEFGASPEQRGHQKYDEVATELGRPPVQFPFPAVAYTVNHSESLWAAKSGERRRVRHPSDLVPARHAKRLLDVEFAAPDLAKQMVGATRLARVRIKSSGQLLRTRYSNGLSRLTRATK